MKRYLKIGGYVVGGIVVVIIGFVSYINLAFPKVSPAQNMTVEATPERLERGKYLANHVVGCVECHSTRDWTKFAGPIIVGSEGKRGELFDKQTVGVPGTFYSRNITPHNLKNWTDGEIYRLITTGVTKEGKAIFPLMPFLSYASMDPEDVKDVIAYIRTLTPIESTVPDPQYDFPMSLIMKTIPKDATPGTRPETSDTVQYGEYLVTIAACGDCHTRMEKGEPLPGMYLAGGFEFKNQYGDIVRSANLTQSHETGIGLWTEDVFLGKFKTYRDSTKRNQEVKPHEFNTVMPWSFYSGMKDEDLKAIFRYLKTVPPVEYKVEKFTAGK